MNETKKAISFENIKSLIKDVKSNDIELKRKSITLLKDLLESQDQSRESFFIESISKNNGIPELIKILYMDNEPSLQYQVGWMIAYMTTCEPDLIQIIVDINEIDIFISLLSSPDENIKEEIVCTIGNMAGESYTNRDLIIQHGGMEPLINIIKSLLSSSYCDLSLFRNVVSAFSNLFKHQMPPPLRIVCSVLPIFRDLIYFNDKDILEDVCSALYYITNVSDQLSQEVINANICPKLIELLEYPDFDVQLPANSTISNILVGNQNQVQLLLNLSLLPYLLQLLKSPEKLIRIGTCRSISAIINSGLECHLKCLINANLIPALIDILKNDELLCKKGSGSVIANIIINGKKEQVNYLVEQGCIKPLLDLLNSIHLDNDDEEDDDNNGRFVDILLCSIELILVHGLFEQKSTGINRHVELLKDADAFNIIRKFSNDISQNIRKMVSKIIKYQNRA